MIDRFSIGISAGQLAERFGVEAPERFQSRYNVSPSQLVPVITHEDPKGFSFFYWGQPPGWTKNKSLAERIINVRAEQIGEKPTIKKKFGSTSLPRAGRWILFVEKIWEEVVDTVAVCVER